ncbi:MAG: hypothetical protein M1837_003927 [Sclerophora amabilis]|nr:MAG: hypothetical protein M1837_003927 [Sclerophora amabilis]
MSEEKDLLSKIGQLSGQINLHKNKQEAVSSSSNGTRSSPASWRPYRGTPYGTARGRGGRSRSFAPSHRNRTLVLNNATSQSTGVSDSDAPSPWIDSAKQSIQQEATQPQSGSAPSWIAKHDRHKQLINSTVYAKEMQARTRDLEETRKLKAKKRDEREKLKISRYLDKFATPTRSASVVKADLRNTSAHEIVIQGIRFQVTNAGSRLAKMFGQDTTPFPFVDSSLSGLPPSDDANSAKITPKDALVGGVKFHRSKNGNLYRSGVVKAKK